MALHNLPPTDARATVTGGVATQTYDPGRAGLGLLLATTISALWLGCLVVGMLGLILHYPRAHVPETAPLVSVEVVRVDLMKEERSPGVDSPPPDALLPKPPTPIDQTPPPAPPPMANVAIPSPAIAFAVPFEGPSRVVDAKWATVAAPPNRDTPDPAAPALRRLTFGVGEGRQPAPDYPNDALVDKEQGSVVIRFTVAEDGTVTSAQVIKPCRWALLNRAALRTVRERWRMAPGKERTYEVPIEFRISDR